MDVAARQTQIGLQNREIVCRFRRPTADPWQGTLANDGAKMPVSLNIESSDSGKLAIGDKPSERITEMQSEGVALTGVSTGFIDSSDAIRTRARTLKIGEAGPECRSETVARI
jgi:hypothetical protein